MPQGPSQNKSSSSLEDGLLLLVDPCGHQAVDPRNTGVRSSKPSCPCVISSSRPRSCATGPLPPLPETGLHSNKIRDMLCSFNGAQNYWNSVERRVFVCSRDVIYGLVLNVSYQPCAGTSVAAAHGICSYGHWGTSITMCHSRARWCPTAKKSLDRKGRRRAK